MPLLTNLDEVPAEETIYQQAEESASISKQAYIQPSKKLNEIRLLLLYESTTSSQDLGEEKEQCTTEMSLKY